MLLRMRWLTPNCEPRRRRLLVATPLLSNVCAGGLGASVNRIGLDDLTAALADQGITVKRPPYHL